MSKLYPDFHKHRGILAMDPGNSTGWVHVVTQDNAPHIIGGTLYEDLVSVAHTILSIDPAIVVVESFHMYPGKAQSLTWNSFYPCEVIGVIKYVCEISQTKVVMQAPNIKAFAGYDAEQRERLKEMIPQATKHTEDAYIHYLYYKRNSPSAEGDPIKQLSEFASQR